MRRDTIEYATSDIDGFKAAIPCSISLADITRHRSRNRGALRLDCYSAAMYEKFERLIAEREFEIPAILVAMSSHSVSRPSSSCTSARLTHGA